ncbi:hypothetical protein [Crenothrix sp.]|uniref:hypothetical protein n=1 Tax=Crenothrix sp. TaxID=3100433 RepID=UPI00374D65FF
MTMVSNPSTKHQAPSTKHQAPSTKHQAPSTKHQALTQADILFLANVIDYAGV